MTLDIGYVDSWQIRDKNDVHPSHCTAVVKLENLREWIEGAEPLSKPPLCLNCKTNRDVKLFYEGCRLGWEQRNRELLAKLDKEDSKKRSFLGKGVKK